MRIKLALLAEPLIAAKAKEQQIRKPAESVLQKSAEQKPIDTRQEIAKAAGVSHDTIAKVEKIEAQATPEIKAAVKSGDISINQAYKQVKQAEKEQRQEERAERKAYTPPTELPQDDCKLFCADIRNGLSEIADEKGTNLIPTRGGNQNVLVVNESGGLDWGGGIFPIILRKKSACW